MGAIQNIAAAIASFFTTPLERKAPVPKSESNQYAPAANYWSSSTEYGQTFDGEKNLGEIGPIINWVPDPYALRARSWQAYLESDVAQIALNRMSLWMIGTGLRMEAEPNESVLRSENISINKQKFSELIEERFSVWANSTSCHYSERMNLGQLQERAYFNAIIGGDVLCVLRYEDGRSTVQLYDGGCVCSPNSSGAAAEGNTIKHGVERNARGKVIAFHVRTKLLKFERIEAYNSASGLKQAFMVYGLDYRLDDTRGLPIISAVLEKGKNIDRYTAAAVGSAEERQKIVYAIKHNQFSTGENPLLGSLVQAMDVDSPIGKGLPTTEEGAKLAAKMAVTTNKQTFNMPVGAEMQVLDSKQEIHFRDFLSVNFEFYCAVIGIPPNVALQQYNDSFSASRAALKDWENSLIVKRSKFASEFLAPIYAWFLHIDILNGKVRAPGYLAAVDSGNIFVTESYRTARYIGTKVPHIDPVKEVEAVRRKLGPMADNIPLMTIEQAVEELGGCESDSIVEQFADEKKAAEQLGLKPEPIVQPAPTPKPK